MESWTSYQQTVCEIYGGIASKLILRMMFPTLRVQKRV